MKASYAHCYYIPFNSVLFVECKNSLRFLIK